MKLIPHPRILELELILRANKLRYVIFRLLCGLCAASAVAEMLSESMFQGYDEIMGSKLVWKISYGFFSKINIKDMLCFNFHQTS